MATDLRGLRPGPSTPADSAPLADRPAPAASAGSALLADRRLQALAFRVRARQLLRLIRLGLAAGLVGAAAITLVGKLTGYSAWPLAAAFWLGLTLVTALALTFMRAPDAARVARAADGLGLAERISSAIYAESRSASVSHLLIRDARQALAGLRPAAYPVWGDRRPWQALGLGAIVLTLLVALPISPFGTDATSSADAARVSAARQRVEAIELQPPKDDRQASELREKTSAEVRGLRDALARSDSSTDAARAIENTQRQLAHLPGADDYAWRRSLDAAAAALDGQRDQALVPLTRALRDRDTEAVDRALADLAAQFDQPGGMSDAERTNVRSALQAAANAAAGGQPRLGSALRRSASAATGSDLNSQELRDLLAEGVADASALDGLEQSQADLSQLRATTLPPNATLVPARGTPTAYALVRGTPRPGANAGPAGGPQGGNDSQGATASGGQSPQGTNPRNGGQGGGGAGYGDTPSQGQPSTRDAPAAGGSSRPQVAPNSAAPTTYDQVYAPSHLGGDGGPAVQPAGDPTGAGGAGVDLPDGPLTLGDVRPYDQVYAQYAQEARQSSSRQTLPPNVQNVVDQYFGSIAPPSSDNAPPPR